MIRPSVIALSLTAVLVACGGTNRDPDDGTSTGTDGGTPDSGRPDGGSGDGGVSGAISGYVQLNDFSTGSAVQRQAFANFAAGSFDAVLNAGIGCKAVPPGDDPTPPAPSPSPGAITIKAGANVIGTLMPVGDGSYQTLSTGTSPGLAWAAGDTLNVVAAAGLAPGFTMSVTAPAHLMNVTPDVKTSSPTVSKKSDLNVTWSAGTASYVYVSLTQVSELGTGPGVLCAGPDNGNIRVPASLLASLSPGAQTYFGVVRVASKTITPNNNHLSLQAGAGAIGTVTLVP